MNEKLLKKTSIRITLMLIIIFAIIGVLNYKLYTDMNERKDRVVYTSDKEMQKDLCGIHRLIFLISPKKEGNAVLIFNEDYTYSYAAIRDGGDIEIISTHPYSLDCENGIIKLEDRNADIVTVNDKKYIQTNIKGKSIENWMLYEKMKNK